MGRTAEAEWIASEDGVIARSDKDPRWIPKQHKLRSAEVDWTREGQVIVYEGKGPLARDPVWTSGASRIAWVDVTGRGKTNFPKGI